MKFYIFLTIVGFILGFSAHAWLVGKARETIYGKDRK